MRSFFLVDEDGNSMGGVYNASTPADAARYAVRDGMSRIYLHDPQKMRVYCYNGAKTLIQNPSQFTIDRGIQRKTQLQSLGYVDLTTGEVKGKRMT